MIKIYKNIKSKQAIIGTVILSLIMIISCFSVVIMTNNVAKADFESQAYSDFIYSKSVTIDNTQVTSDLNNFPVLVYRASDADLASHVEQADGGDIAFFNKTNETQFNHEIVSYNSSTGELIAWVNVTDISSTSDTIFYMHYGNATIADQEDVANTWSNHYLAVWHMDNTSDALGNYPLTAVIGANVSVNGKIGSCYNFNGTGFLYNKTLLDTFPSSNQVTYECWFYPNSTATEQWIMAKDNVPAQDFFRIELRTDQFIRIEAEADNAGTIRAYGRHLYSTEGYWYYVGASYVETSKTTIYVNSSTNTSVAVPGVMNDGNYRDFGIGANAIGDSGVYRFSGYIDEARVSDINRSAAWMNSCYNNQLNNTDGGFLSYGTEDGDASNVSTYALNGLTSGRLTWTGIAGDIAWCNTSGDGHEWLDINMTINSTDNVTDILVYITDLNDTNAWINASNITMYCTNQSNETYYSFGSFEDGGSNITLNQSTWETYAPALDNPFNSTGLKNCNYSIYCVFRLQIPVGLSTDEFRTPTTTSCKIYLGRYI